MKFEEHKLRATILNVIQNFKYVLNKFYIQLTGQILQFKSTSQHLVVAMLHCKILLYCEIQL